MCGIVGIVNDKNILYKSIKVLKKLEYRGYDSAGVFLCNDNEKEIYRSLGTVDILKKKINFDIEVNSCIGHTRWATHGKPTLKNTHPHYSFNERFFMVHNGTIENYVYLKEKYCKDIEFYGQTDTEVIVNVIPFFVEKKKLSMLSAIQKLNEVIEGSAAFCVIDVKDSKKIYFSKNKSPLVIGKNKNSSSSYICSDISAISEFCDEYTELKDGDYGYIFEKELFLNNDLYSSESIFKKVIKTSNDQYDKKEFEHYMIKEIHEQPNVLKSIVDKYIKNDVYIYDKEALEEIKKAKKIVFIAAGTSYHACMVLENIIQTQLKKDTAVYISSEFTYSDIPLNDKYIYIFLSQSGETADSISALNKIRNYSKANIISITNVQTSTLSTRSDFDFNICAGIEISVASTKAFTAQIATFMGIIFSINNIDASVFKDNILKTAQIMQKILSNQNIYIDYAKKIKDKKNVFYLGRQYGYALALEGALKLKEITYIQSEGFASGELKHGTIALIENNTPVITIISNKNNTEKIIRSNIEEVKARGADVFTITQKRNSNENDNVIIDDIDENFAVITLTLPLQLIAYYTSVFKGINVDMPRNLAKSVTVE